MHCTSVHNVFAITINCLYSFFSLFPRLEHPAGWICARYKSFKLLLLLLLLLKYTSEKQDGISLRDLKNTAKSTGRQPNSSHLSTHSTQDASGRPSKCSSTTQFHKTSVSSSVMFGDPYTLKTPGSDLTRKRVRGGQTHFGVRPTRNPGQTDPESESERHFGLRFRSFLPGFQISLTQEWVWPHGTLFRVKSDPGVFRVYYGPKNLLYPKSTTQPKLRDLLHPKSTTLPPPVLVNKWFSSVSTHSSPPLQDPSQQHHHFPACTLLRTEGSSISKVHNPTQTEGSPTS